MLVCASEGADALELVLEIHNHHSTAAKQLNASYYVSATTSPPSSRSKTIRIIAQNS